MATFTITTDYPKRKHTMFGKRIGTASYAPTFYVWYLPTGKQFARGIGGGYSSSGAARVAAREYAVKKLGTSDVKFVT